VCADPLVTAVSIAAAPVAPCATDKLAGLAAMKKSDRDPGTVNEDQLVPVPPAVVTEMAPLVAPLGTNALMRSNESTW
jgi:hypothetical protein